MTSTYFNDPSQLQTHPQAPRRRGIPWYIKLLIIALITLSVAAIMRILTPPPPVYIQSPQMQTNFDGTSSSFAKVDFTGTRPEFPTSLPLAKIVSTSESREQFIENFTTNNSLIETEPYKWNSSEYFLYAPKGDYPIILSKKNHTPLDSFSREIATTNSQAWVNELFPDTPFVPIPSVTTPLSINEDYNPNAISDDLAVAYKVYFGHEISGFPVLVGNENNFPMVVLISKARGEQEIEFQLPFYSLEVLKPNSPLINLDEALKNVQRGQAQVVQALHEEADPINLSAYKEVNLTQVELEYRLDSLSGYVAPHYKFQGSGISEVNGKNQHLTIITPAVASQSISGGVSK